MHIFGKLQYNDDFLAIRLFRHVYDHLKQGTLRNVEFLICDL